MSLMTKDDLRREQLRPSKGMAEALRHEEHVATAAPVALQRQETRPAGTRAAGKTDGLAKRNGSLEASLKQALRSQRREQDIFKSRKNATRPPNQASSAEPRRTEGQRFLSNHRNAGPTHITA